MYNFIFLFQNNILSYIVDLRRPRFDSCLLPFLLLFLVLYQIYRLCTIITHGSHVDKTCLVNNSNTTTIMTLHATITKKRHNFVMS
jgi:hypothetical protein